MHLFYAPEITDKSQEYTLSEEESKHSIRVLRLKVGSQVELLNGKGLSVLAEIADDHPKKCKLRILKTEYHPRISNEIHLALAPTKNMDRMEWLMEKATEIGLSKLTFLKCDHNERSQLKLDRLEKIAISAMKQSKRYYLPEICELVAFHALCKHIQMATLDIVIQLQKFLWPPSQNRRCLSSGQKEISQKMK